METPYITNRLLLSGTAAGEPAFDHVCCERAFYSFPLDVARKSGAFDTLRVLAAEHLLSLKIDLGDPISIAGTLRAYRHTDADGAHLCVVAFARELLYVKTEPENHVELVGVISRAPVYRKTPLGREICDLFLSVERAFLRRDCLPVIVWCAAAREAGSWQSGDAVKVIGRLQSRDYVKTTPDGHALTKTAYEVSASHIARLEPAQVTKPRL